jgi:hypothetical protein
VYSNFRAGSHELEIERGRYRHTPREERLCSLCDKNAIENEFHFLLCCEFYTDIRISYIPSKYYTIPSLHKFNILMTSKHEPTIKAIATFLYYAFKRRQQNILR